MAEVVGPQSILFEGDVIATIFVDDATWRPVRVGVDNGLGLNVWFRLALETGQNLTQVVIAGTGQSWPVPAAIRNKLTFVPDAVEDTNPDWSFQARAGR